MSQKRNMPTKKSILKHWENNYQMELYDNVCWGCAFTSVLYRCHLLAKCKGGKDDLDNLVLLCDFCHNIQENNFSYNEKVSNQFKQIIIDYPPFLKVRWDYFNSLIKHGVIDLSKYKLSI